MGTLATFPDAVELVSDIIDESYSLGDLADLQAKKWDGWTFTNAGDLYADSVSGVKVSASYHNAPRIPQPHECGHCYRQKHPEPLTERQSAMYDSNHFDASYDPTTDDSPVVCIGSDYEGPMPAPATQRYGTVAFATPSYPSWTQLYNKYVKAAAKAFDTELITQWIDESFKVSTWLPGEPYYYIADGSPYLPVAPEKKCTEDDKLPIKFNDWDNWRPWEKPGPWYPVEPALDIKWEQWRTSFPKPESPGYDFTAFNKPETYPKGKK